MAPPINTEIAAAEVTAKSWFATFKAWLISNYPTAIDFVVAQKKWFILGAVLLTVWCTAWHFAKPKRVLPPLPKFETLAPVVQPIAPVALRCPPVRHAAVAKRVVKAPAPVPVCQFLWIKKPC